MQKNIKINASSIALPLDLKMMVRPMFMAIMSTIILLIAIFWSQNVWAADKSRNLNEDPVIQQEAADFIQRLANKALTGLHQEGATLADQEIRFRGILSEGFDVEYIGKISLGRHRKRASAENLENYYALFPEYLVRVYTTRLSRLDTRTVAVGRVLPNGKRDMYVRTKITDGEAKTYDVDWRIRPQNSDAPEKHSYKIIDVKIEGISMARTQRDDFASRIAESGITGLISFMQNLVDGKVMVAESN